MWPQYVVLGLHAFVLVVNVLDRKGVFQTLVAPGFGLFVLYEGGFFAGLGWAP